MGEAEVKKLTFERKHPGNFKYGSQASRQELEEKLGAIEHRSEDLIGEICDYCCTNPLGSKSQEELDAICERCPATKLAKLIGLE